LFAGAAGEADAGADHVVLLARSIATFAFAVFLVVVALLLGWRHHGFDGVEGDVIAGGSFEGRDAFAVVIAEVSFLAGAAGDAVERADDDTVFAGSIAAFALTEFLVIAALLLG